MSEKEVYFPSKRMDQVPQLELKTPSQSTKGTNTHHNIVDNNVQIKGDLNYLRKLLNGKLRYNSVYTYDVFDGTMKLSKDPKEY
jgi:hypothetical protein